MKVKFNYNGTDYFFNRPNLGNKNDLAFQRVSRRSRGGDLIIFRDEDWPKTETLGLDFEFTTQSEYEAFLRFVDMTTGTIIQYTDHENRTWEGVIQNPDARGSQGGRFTFNVSITFEGDQV